MIDRDEECAGKYHRISGGHAIISGNGKPVPPRQRPEHGTDTPEMIQRCLHCTREKCFGGSPECFKGLKKKEEKNE